MKIEDVKVGMKVKVVKAFNDEGWPGFNGKMLKTIGKIGEVVRLLPKADGFDKDGVRVEFPDGYSWIYLVEVLEDAKPLHKFKPMDQVVVYRKVNKAPWTDERMDKTVGLRGVVTLFNGREVRGPNVYVALENGEKWWYPHTALKRYKG